MDAIDGMNDMDSMRYIKRTTPELYQKSLLVRAPEPLLCAVSTKFGDLCAKGDRDCFILEELTPG